jgi:putative alpha-1,2-mannosidase
MEAHQLSDKNIYTSKVFLNGTPVEQPSITFQQIVDGGTLLFKMTDQ